MEIQCLSENATLPTRGSPFSAGYDLYSAYDIVIPANDKALIKTDLAIAVPEGYYGRIAPRSGYALKDFIGIGGGVIDRDYRGNVGVVVFNHGKEFEVKKGQRIAQLILEKCGHFELYVVDKLSDTTRGEGGFGSTGN